MAATLHLVQPAPRPAEGHCAGCGVRPLTFCAPLQGWALAELEGIAGHATLRPGDTLFREGEPAACFFNVTEGALKLFKLLPDGRRQITGFLFAGDVLGLGAEAVYGCTAEALTAVRLCRFPRRRLETLMAAHPEMERRLLGLAGHELAEAQEQMLLLGRKTAQERLASFLLQLSQRARRRGRPDDPVDLPMGRSDIADYLGLTTETVSRGFTRLKTAGLIRLLPGHRVALAERHRLEALAAGL